MRYVIALCVVVGLAFLASWHDEYRAVEMVLGGELSPDQSGIKERLPDGRIIEYDDWAVLRKPETEWRRVELMRIDTFPNWDETGIEVDTVIYRRWMRWR